MAAGKVKIKEMGLRDGHPEKEGVLVDLKDLVAEVRTRISRKSKLDEMVKHAEGLRVVGGIRGEQEAATTTGSATTEIPELEEPSAIPDESANPVGDDAVPDTEKPAEESMQSQEAIGAIPAS
jgi:histidyl-tRNA synthetase